MGQRMRERDIGRISFVCVCVCVCHRKCFSFRASSRRTKVVVSQYVLLKRRRRTTVYIVKMSEEGFFLETHQQINQNGWVCMSNQWILISEKFNIVIFFSLPSFVGYYHLIFNSFDSLASHSCRILQAMYVHARESTIRTKSFMEIYALQMRTKLFTLDVNACTHENWFYAKHDKNYMNHEHTNIEICDIPRIVFIFSNGRKFTVIFIKKNTLLEIECDCECVCYRARAVEFSNEIIIMMRTSKYWN